MTQEFQDAATLDSVLATLHDMLEDGATREEVLGLAALYPGFRDAILVFTAEWFVAGESDLDDDKPAGERTVSNHYSLLERFWAASSQEEEEDNPFERLETDRIAEVAAHCRVDSGILRKLSLRLIEAGTIPGRLVGWLAGELGASPATLYAFLEGAPVPARVDFFAPNGPVSAGKISFEKAVTSSTLDLTQKRFWLPDLAA